MIKSEKLFLLINEIDEELIEDADGGEEKPIQMRPEPRSPIKGIIALAACAAVLAVGIFAIVKFRIGGNFDPVSVPSEYVSDTSDSSDVSDSSDSSDCSDDPDNSDQSSYPDISLEFTEDDLELQAMLTKLVAGAEDIDKMFESMGADTGLTFKINEYHRGNFYDGYFYMGEYYLIPEGQRTESGLFAVPQSYDEMEELVNRYFSPQAASFYMSWVSKGSMTENPDGTFNVEVQNGSNPIFIEIDGKMYRSTLGESDGGLGIDCETAKIIRRSEKSIDFSYWGYDYKNYGGDKLAQRTGTITLENGISKLHFFNNSGFIPEFPSEYTERDLELQEILKALRPGYTLDSILSANSVACSGDVYKFILPGSSNALYYIELVYPQPQYTFPRSCEELEEMLLEYFTREATDNYMKNAYKGTMTENPDGTYSVTLDKELGWWGAAFIEIDGKMYYHTSVASGGVLSYYNSAQVIEETDNTITYTCTIAGYTGFDQLIKKIYYERGGWKLDPSYTVNEYVE